MSHLVLVPPPEPPVTVLPVESETLLTELKELLDSLEADDEDFESSLEAGERRRDFRLIHGGADRSGHADDVPARLFRVLPPESSAIA
jgi:hypothetical protein